MERELESREWNWKICERRMDWNMACRAVARQDGRGYVGRELSIDLNAGIE